MKRHYMHDNGWRAAWCCAVFLAVAGTASAQLVNYGEQLGAYRDQQSGGIKLQDSVTPGVAARTRVSRALARDRVVDQQALVQPDGTLKLPSNQTNLVIRSDYQQVQQGTDGQVRIASPVIQGNVSGNVTLYVEGRELENITILNNGR